MNSQRSTTFTSLVMAFMALTCFTNKSHANIVMEQVPESTLSIITVSGVGEVSETPDRAVIQAAIKTENMTADHAISENNSAMTNVKSALEALNIQSADIETSMLTLSSYHFKPHHDFPPQSSEPTIRYRASHNINVFVRDVTRIGNILQQMVRNGANRVFGIEFKVENPKSLLDRARREAVTDARSRAGLYATAAGVTIIRVLSIDEGRSKFDMRYMDLSGVGYGSPQGPADVVPITVPSKVTYDARVTIRYIIR